MANMDDRSGEVAGVASFFLALSTVGIALRCYCRITVVKNFGWDDWFAVIAYVSLHFIHIFSRFESGLTLVVWQLFFFFFCAFCLTGTMYGTGKHIQDIPPADLPIGLKVSHQRAN